MGRQQTRLVQKLSPHLTRVPKAATARYVKTTQQRSPLAAVYPVARNARLKLQGANTNRFLKTRSQLSSIAEVPLEEEEEEPGHDHQYDPYRALDALARDDDRGARRNIDDEDEDIMDWDDETTLMAMLEESTHSDNDEQEDLVALANKLKAPMSSQRDAMKQYLGETIIPVMSRVKKVHGVIEDKVDLAFGAGILTFDEACKKVETMALRDEDDLKIAYMDCQSNMKHLLSQLQQAYARREGLWCALQQDADKCADRAKAALEALPAEVEFAIAQLEKKSKELDKDTSSASKQKMLKGILEKLN
ncbi:uncharacterized protein LAESUDRAFT_674696 [Laetiporus sulphureus 93-53]|uniref:Uncharacterized protein n=1 Tax=Laetiporus sulphureus 93-53 TaxID=1314785 RepID=A0A165G289_9APHY|nr:uncharacterized protein LAESUDRAFT_674696 [Laetiporus sulphureus 93-53]KZT09731.1 hypothetical protein LAESUDRAFT_674696 [Laetiporus sulphureus 93-53]